jgi:hypothetical protein
MTLLPNCTNSCVQALVDGTYRSCGTTPVDASFGITSKIFLDQISTTGTLIKSLELPNSSQKGVPPTKDQMVSSFSSNSELGLNLSADGRHPAAVVDSTNPVGESFYRVVSRWYRHLCALDHGYGARDGTLSFLR